MKCLVMSLIVMVNMGINLGFATAPANDFAYNSEPADSTGVETRYIYRKTDDGRYLRHHLKYRCTYDDAHRLLAREVLRWDADLQDYRPAYTLRYAYAADATVTIECARWDTEEQAYTDLRERAVYTPDAQGFTYQTYAYDDESDTWNLTCEHNVQSPLLADK